MEEYNEWMNERDYVVDVGDEDAEAAAAVAGEAVASTPCVSVSSFSRKMTVEQLLNAASQAAAAQDKKRSGSGTSAAGSKRSSAAKASDERHSTSKP